jgi:hypothetical protein
MVAFALQLQYFPSIHEFKKHNFVFSELLF